MKIVLDQEEYTITSQCVIILQYSTLRMAYVKNTFETTAL